MPAPGEIYTIAERFRRELLRHERAASSEMVRYYGAAWQRIKARIDKLTKQYYEAVAAGEISEQQQTTWLFQFERLQTLQQEVEREIAEFARFAETRIAAEQYDAVQAAGRYAELMVEAGLPRGLAYTWNRLPVDAVSDLVGFTQPGSPLRTLLDELGPAASESIRRTLITGLALGQNPREIARQARQALGGNLARALTTSRTETLRACREATRRNYEANSDVVEGWIWRAACDEHTCVVCWALHGTKHKNEEILDGHPNCRCVMVELTKTWEELGAKGVPETRAEVEPGEDRFVKLPEEQQRAILGHAGYEAYKAGAVRLSDFVGQRSDPRWGTMRYARSLREMLGAGEASKWYAQAAAARPGVQQLAQPLTPAQRLTKMARRIDGPLARRTKTVNNWDGTVSVQHLPPGLLGIKEWGCSITVSNAIIGNDADLWPTLNHEMLHALSEGINPWAYGQFKGWEEGVVEKLQRILGPKVLKAIGEQPYVGLGAYNHYIAELERMRAFLGRSESSFYLQLLRTPLADREQAVIAMGQRLPKSKQQQWQQLLASALPILRAP